MSGIFSIGISGLNAARAALDVTSHNISNVNTDGYNRQRLSQSAATPQFVGYGYAGRGVDLYAVSRLYDSFMDEQLQNVTASSSGFQAQATALSDIDNLITDANAGLSNQMQGFYASLQTLSQQPASIAARQSVISQAESLSGRFQSMNTRMEEVRNGLINQINTSVDGVNSYARQIAALNEQILSLNQGEGRVPNDLLDQRDTLVRDLNKLIKTDVVEQSDGMYSVYIGQGHPLVIGETSYEMTMTRGAPAQPEDPEAPSLAIKLPGTNNTVVLNSQLIGGGSIAGAMTTLQYDVARVQTDLGRMAVEFSDAMNRQQALGVDLNGQPATAPMFADLTAFRTNAENATTPAGEAKAMRDALRRFAVAVQDPAQLAVASGIQAGAAVPVDPTEVPGGKPAITAIWQVSNLSPAANPLLGAAPALALNYIPGNTPPFEADYGGTIVPVTQSATQSGVYEFTLASGEHIAFKFEGQAATAQTIPVTPRTGAASESAQLDNANLLEMARLQTRPLMAATPNSTSTFMPAVGAARTGSLQSFYGQTVSYVGSRTNVVQVSLTAQEAALQEVKLKRESLSGVNLDEEAANLIRYQQAYQASSKVIQVAQEIFQSLLDLR
ncbi:flagellar hook-associated protein FlgK [Vogesella alkaliphila]|uniref:Flagellar hook-associated protein 1 n=1 Tax=Vogesella alkaliphila TaxID=1193621 RepID=A0ABQ2YSX1_9NEIS|nr:flagellar hook-associated protein FlgK [Vogesella alkaliphila]GGX91583.1 flagellar hook-associated protein 1 [Vogesella alkaliphila]